MKAVFYILAGSTRQHGFVGCLPGEEGSSDRLRKDGQRERTEGRCVRKVRGNRRNDRHLGKFTQNINQS